MSRGWALAHPVLSVRSGPHGTRTRTLPVDNRLLDLFELPGRDVMPFEAAGLEPAFSCLQSRRAFQLPHTSFSQRGWI
jgi:hypothetical protein